LCQDRQNYVVAALVSLLLFWCCNNVFQNEIFVKGKVIVDIYAPGKNEKLGDTNKRTSQAKSSLNVRFIGFVWSVPTLRIHLMRRISSTDSTQRPLISSLAVRGLVGNK